VSQIHTSAAHPSSLGILMQIVVVSEKEDFGVLAC
jgi:hypothetical protein